jgi:THO complex subunit 1
VNRQGDYNNENVTIFDEQTTALPTSTPDADSKVDDVSAPADEKSNAATDPTEPEGNPKPNSMTADELYPTFWSLQKSFAYPPRVCEQSVLDEFKKGFESTLAKFKDVPKVIQGTSSDSPRGTKRKSDEMEHDEFASSFNPKYLTSRELFQLEVCFKLVVREEPMS